MLWFRVQNIIQCLIMNSIEGIFKILVIKYNELFGIGYFMLLLLICSQCCYVHQTQVFRFFVDNNNKPKKNGEFPSSDS